MKRVVLLICAVLFSFPLHGCGLPKADPIAHNAIEVPDGRNSKKITLKRVVASINRGADIGKMGWGLACLSNGSVTWKSGRKSINDEELTSVFAEELKRYNYRIVGDPSELFEDTRSGAEIAVGARITDIKYDICYPMAGWGDYRSGSASASITVDWQVYNTLDKKVVFRKSSSGSASASFKDGRDYDTLFNAFSNAVQGLLADKGFLEIVMEKEPSPPMGGLSDNANDLLPTTTNLSAPSGGGGGYVVANSKAPGSLAAAKNSVVVLEIPGGHGSGFLVGNSGYILTNDHVVKDLSTVRITFSNGSKAAGRVLKTDSRQDVALVQIDTPPVTGLPFRLEDVPAATDVYAIGAPFDTKFQGSLTKGIVSGYRRDKKGRWLQSDAAINGGNSGGPLVDNQGRVVGMCSSGMGETDSGINFFVPIADAFNVMGIQPK